MRTSLIFVLTLLAAAAAGDLWGSADLTARSSYLFRGVVYVDAPVLEPSASAGLSGFSTTLWGSMEMTEENDYGDGYGFAAGEFTEVDFILDYTRDLGPLWVYGGLGKYWYPNTGYESSSELYICMGPNVSLSPSLNLYRDLEQAEGLYGSVSLAQGIPVGCVEPAVNLNLGYGNRRHNLAIYGVNKAALADLTIGISAPIPLSSVITLTPSADFSTLLDGEIKDAFEDPSHFRAGISVTWGFLQ